MKLSILYFFWKAIGILFFILLLLAIGSNFEIEIKISQNIRKKTTIEKELLADMHDVIENANDQLQLGDSNKLYDMNEVIYFAEANKL